MVNILQTVYTIQITATFPNKLSSSHLENHLTSAQFEMNPNFISFSDAVTLSSKINWMRNSQMRLDSSGIHPRNSSSHIMVKQWLDTW